LIVYFVVADIHVVAVTVIVVVIAVANHRLCCYRAAAAAAIIVVIESLLQTHFGQFVAVSVAVAAYLTKF